MEVIEPCPDCEISNVLLKASRLGDKMPLYRVQCSDCSLTTCPAETKEEAVKEWNSEKVFDPSTWA